MSASRFLYAGYLRRDHPFDWSGTGIPKTYADRKDLRNRGKAAVGLLDSLDAQLATAAAELSAQMPGGVIVELDRLILGQGYAAILNASMLEKTGKLPTRLKVVESLGALSNDSAVLSDALRDHLLFLGLPEEWHLFEPKAMGQSPANLSPDVFQNLPLWFSEHFIGPPFDCLEPDNLDQCYLRSDFFGWAMALERIRLRASGIKAEVVSIKEDAVKSRYLVEFTLMNGIKVKLAVRNLDVAAGPGPPRRLPGPVLSDETRLDLRSKQRPDSNWTWSRHMFGSEVLIKATDLPPRATGASRKIVVFYGGSPTAAWGYERLVDLNTLKPLGAGPENPYDIRWLARPDKDDPNDKEKPFDSVRIGLRNRRTLAHSEPFRRAAEVTNVTRDGDRVKVKFKLGNSSTEETVLADLFVEAIGPDAFGAGGVADILEPDLAQKLVLLKDKWGERPLAFEHSGSAYKLRILGAAILGTLDAVKEVVKNEYLATWAEFEDSLAEGVRIPPGITVAGITVSRANDPDYAIERTKTGDLKVNINTWSVKELENLYVNSTASGLSSGRDAAHFLLKTHAVNIVRKRAERAFKVFPLAGEQSGEQWIPGYRSICDIRYALPKETPEEMIKNVLHFIRV